MQRQILEGRQSASHGRRLNRNGLLLLALEIEGHQLAFAKRPDRPGAIIDTEGLHVGRLSHLSRQRSRVLVNLVGAAGVAYPERVTEIRCGVGSRNRSGDKREHERKQRPTGRLGREGPHH